MSPKVTFVVPCYKLAHLLPECIHSILKQTYEDFEVLIMDDCSPDNTPQVAQGFQDHRVRHVRNSVNLGHLRNYNKGIELARGKYIWLISADDRLRTATILERYVRLMEANPQVGYVFCPGVGLLNGQETRVINSHGDEDWIRNGPEFLLDLLNANSVIAAAGMARKQCYERVSLFPLDMPWAGDWYLWCVFALHFEVAYLAEPMVNYRTHQWSMTNTLTTAAPQLRVNDDLILHWRVKMMAEALGQKAVVNKCRNMVAYQYARFIAAQKYGNASGCATMEDFERFLCRFDVGARESRALRARLHGCLGDIQVRNCEARQALRSYLRALQQYFWLPKLWAKCLLVPARAAWDRLALVRSTSR